MYLESGRHLDCEPNQHVYGTSLLEGWGGYW